MHDPMTFEARLADAMGRYADLAPLSVDAAAVTRAVAADRASGLRGRWNVSLGRSWATVVVLFALLVLTAAGAALVGSVLLRSDPITAPTGVFVPTGSMLEARIDATATRLPDGRVLIAGGWSRLRAGQEDEGTDVDGQALATAELFDPVTEVFSPTGSMGQARRDATATLLADGRVLITGGFGSAPTADGGMNLREVLDSAEIFDPSTSTFSPAGAMTSSRGLHSATILQDGTVLLVGGLGSVGGELPTAPGTGPLDSVESFDPSTQTFRSITAPMHTGRLEPTSSILRDGRVLIVGDAGSLPVADIYDPITETFTEVPATGAGATARAAALLPDGRVLVTGEGLRSDGTRTLTPSWQLFDATTGSFTDVEPAGGFGDVVVPLQDGRILVMGAPPFGLGLPVEPTSQVYDPDTSSIDDVGPPTDARESGQTATLLQDGRVLVAGGRLGESQDVGSTTNPPYAYVAYGRAELFHP